MKKDFLWGAATSAYQVEGESLTHGKGKSNIDVAPERKGITDYKITSDHYNHYKEDIQLFSELGLKAYRFSMSWPRIIPDGVGKINKEGIEFYKNVLSELKSKNITPIVTIYHSETPVALLEQGGWANRDLIIPAFENFAKVLFENFGKDVKYWIVLNEQGNEVLFGDFVGMNVSKTKKEIFEIGHIMTIAQAKVYKLCHEMTDALVGSAPNMAAGYPASCKPEDVIAAQNFNAYRNWAWLDLPVKGMYNNIQWKILSDNGWTPTILDGDMELLKENKPDFIGFNYYATYTLTGIKDKNNPKSTQDSSIDIENYFYSVANDNLPKSEWGWEIDPIGFRVTIRELWDRYHLPLMVTENGLGAKDVLTEDFKVHDQYRIEYLKSHLVELKKATEEGIDIIGYNPWSAIDLVSTHEGFNKRYGFIYVNRDEFDLKDLKRYKKDSFEWYRKVIDSNGEEL